jgi:sugar fermentation stimulation protein A
VQYPELLEGRLVRRYKRFLADVELTTGEIITAHCANTGSMRNCCDPGSRVWLFDSSNPGRKLRYTWELVEVEGHYLACINTNRANHLVKEAILDCRIAELAGYDELLTERPYGLESSRIDILLRGDGKPDCYVEIKNLTLQSDNGLGLFPDAVTVRGRKHLRELAAVVREGDRAVLFYHVAHTGIVRIKPAWKIDPEYALTLSEVMEAGVEVVVYGAEISPQSIELSRRLEFSIHPNGWL